MTLTAGIKTNKQASLNNSWGIMRVFSLDGYNWSYNLVTQLNFPHLLPRILFLNQFHPYIVNSYTRSNLKAPNSQIS